MAIPADGPGMHPRWNMAKRRHLAHGVEPLEARLALWRVGQGGFVCRWQMWGVAHCSSPSSVFGLIDQGAPCRAEALLNAHRRNRYTDVNIDNQQDFVIYLHKNTY
jgi:hypothetical protein